MKSYSLCINGESKDSKVKKDIINPATKEVLAMVSFADTREVELAIESARTAFDSGPWPSMSLAERKEILLKISDGILENLAQLAQIETLNSGKPIKETTFMDVPSSAETFKYFANNLEEFLKSEDKDIESKVSPAKASLFRQPRGVVALIVPFNYPLLIASWKMAQALASGNTIILKPASLTPLSVLELGKIISNSGMPRGVVNIIPAKGEDVGKLLSADKRIDMISFTGSNKVGRKILKHSAKNVKKLIMELGGKSASIILKEADLEAAVNSSLCSIFLNQGQMCTAMSRILIDEAIYDDFVSDFIKKAEKIKLGNGLDFQTQMGPLISASQRESIIEHLEQAQTQGAKILSGGKIPSDPDLKNGFFFEPTVLTDVNEDMDIFKEEVFGPVVCLSKFSNINQSISLANKSDFALAASIWSKDEAKARELAKKIDAGTIWINTYGMFYNELPYGGFKQSGFGKELGKEGFLEYTRLKNVVIDAAKDSKPLVNYWYGF